MKLPMLPDMEIEASKAATSMAEAIEMSPDKVDEVRMAVVEACINAFEHSGAVHREVTLNVAVLGKSAAEKLCITVQDSGGGFEPDSVEEPSLERKLKAERKRGWGLKIIRGLMDEVEIRSSKSGTTVVMCKLR
ncbi:MAG: ATP-binding protein [Deltaproteobacteria bacterium]|nr:ATP-binding protein [Deltaproteobacteria bacterium]